MAVGGCDVGKPRGPTAPTQLEQARRGQRRRVNEKSSAQQYHPELLGMREREPGSRTRAVLAIGKMEDLVQVQVQGRIRAQAHMKFG
jgi:hypothetical protein